ncbi:MAG: endoglucanase, partial [Clostridiales bacterium]|nr:endoglucanase [Clostridiales bacterium]
GQNWHRSVVFDLNGERIEDDEKALKVMADRVNPDVFYGFGDDATFFVSRDGGGTFYQKQRPEGFYIGHLCGIDGLNRSEIRVESGKEGVIWISMNEGGLWRIKYDKDSDTFLGKRISKDGDKVKCQGMGKNAPNSEFKTLYINGTIDGEYGFWRSFDEGENWQRINDENQMYGSIRSIAGDPRTFGRFYLATGTRGILYGEPAK